MLFVLSMIFGALGITANIIIYQQRTGKKLLVWKLTSDIFWVLHYVFLGGYSGAGASMVGVVRESIFLNRGKKWADSKLWLLLFVALSVASAAITWNGYMSLLPTIASVTSVFAFWRANPKLTRILAYVIAGCMMTYNVFVLSYMGIVSEAFVLISTTVGIIRVAVLEKKNKKA